MGPLPADPDSNYNHGVRLGAPLYSSVSVQLGTARARKVLDLVPGYRRFPDSDGGSRLLS